MSSPATLKVDDAPQLIEGARRITVDCQHGTTTILWANAPGGVQLDEDFTIRLALLKHTVDEPHCRCIRRLWRERFGCEWPDVTMAGGRAT